jgi:putative transposase
MSRLAAHVVWTTRYRAPVLAVSGDARLAAALGSAASSIGCALLAVGNGVDHVHALVAYPPRLAPATVVQTLKGVSSRRLGLRWQVGYWAESVGPRDLEAVGRYVSEQRLRHKATVTREPWEHL